MLLYFICLLACHADKTGKEVHSFTRVCIEGSGQNDSGTGQCPEGGLLLMYIILRQLIHAVDCMLGGTGELVVDLDIPITPRLSSGWELLEAAGDKRSPAC